MGAGQSTTRTLKVDNDDPASVIKVSEAVVERLKGNLNQESVAHPPPQQQQQLPIQAPISAPVAPAQTHSRPLQEAPQGVPIYYFEPSFTSQQVLAEKEEQLRNNDKYWKNKIIELEKSYKKMGHLMEEEYEQAMADIKKTFHSEPAAYRLPPCGEMGDRLKECYQQNPGAPLKCTSIVGAFSDCVNTHRLQALTAKAS